MRASERAAGSLDGHEVALAALPGPPALLAQCECGWRASFPEVTMFTDVASRVDEHHGRVILGVVL